MTPSPVLSLIPTAAGSSGHQVPSRGAERSRRDAVGALDGFWWERIIPAAGSGSRHLSRLSFSHPARGFALVSTPRAGLDSPAMTRRSAPMSINNDFRAASGLKRWPAPPADLPADDPPAPPQGAGLFEVARGGGERAITSVRRIAGAERAPGSALIGWAAWLLALIGAGALYVSFSAQRQYVFGARHQDAAAIIEALLLDVLLIVFTLLALGLSRAGKSSRTERALILACAVASAYMNVSDADTASPRSVVAYAVAPVALAVVVDRVVSVIRRHVLGVDEVSAWTALGRATAAAARLAALTALYSLRFALAPRPTAKGLRCWVLVVTPLPEAERPAIPMAEVPAIEPPEITEPPELEGATKKARLRWWYEQDPACGDRDQAADAARRLCGRVDLGEGTARTYIYGFIADLDRRAS